MVGREGTYVQVGEVAKFTVSRHLIIRFRDASKSEPLNLGGCRCWSARHGAEAPTLKHCCKTNSKFDSALATAPWKHSRKPRRNRAKEVADIGSIMSNVPLKSPASPSCSVRL